MTEAPVILVEDDAAVRAALHFALELEGLQVRSYASGHELLGDAAIPSSGCLVIDYHMPELSGSDLLGALRRRQVRLPAILITGDANRQVRDMAVQAGFQEVLEKPLDDGSLVHGIARALCASDESGA